jgi:dipeptidyl aminopeptidase/acylaminoacyl peptidase
MTAHPRALPRGTATMIQIRFFYGLPVLVVGFVVVTALGTALRGEDARRPMTAEDLWSIQRVGTPVVSPDGTRAAFTVTAYDIEQNSSSTSIHLAKIDGTTRRFTTGGTDSSPAWSADGRRVAFVSRRDGQTAQLYVIPADGGEARKVTDLPVPVSAPKWFPDGERIAVVATLPPEYDGDFEELRKILDRRENSRVSARVTENRIYRHWDRWLTDGDYPHIFSVEVATGALTDLTPGWRRHFAMTGAPEYDISPDGRWIAVSANSNPEPYDYLNYDIFLLNADGSGNSENLTSHNPANDLSPVFSPSGAFLVYGKQTRTDFYADRVRLVRFDLETRRRSVLTEDVDLSFQQWRFSRDGERLLAHAEDRGAKSIFALPVSGGPVSEIFRGGTNDGVAEAAGDRLIFLTQGLARPPELAVTGRDGSGFDRLTRINDGLLDEIVFAEVEDLTYPGANGVEVQMYVVKPPGFDPAGKWPLLMLIHGGPHGIFGDGFHFRWNAQLFAAPGYVVALPNFHGSTSFGQAFAESIHGAHSDLPFRDVMKATDFLLQRDYLDPERTAAAGGSYGGYLVSWIAGQTDRYAALINHAGVYNIMGQFASDVTHHREAAYGGAPWKGLDSMQRWNPAVHAEMFRTPMLVIHGERDYRVPVTQGLEIYGVYKGKDLEARLVYFPDENHWILKPRNSIFWFGEFHGWLERYLGAGAR